MQRLLSFLFLLACSSALAQERQRLEGYIQIPNEGLSSYYLEVTINGTRVTGFSVTNHKDGNRLKASVVGRLSPASEMYIEETGSLDGPDSRYQTYCYFRARLKLTVVGGKRRWSGPFDSRQTDGTACAAGIMTIMEDAPPLDPPKAVKPSGMRVSDDPPKRITPPAKPRPVAPPVVAAAPKPPPPKDTVKLIAREDPPKPKPVVVVAPPKAAEKPAPLPVDTNHCTRSYDWHSDSLSFDVWDGWLIDGDILSLSIGGRSLMDHSKLSEQKQHFSIPLARGLNIINISFHDEGLDRPNTPNMILYDGGQQYRLNIAGKQGETARICINRVR